MRWSVHWVLRSQSSLALDVVESAIIGGVVAGGAGDMFLHFLGIGVSDSEGQSWSALAAGQPGNEGGSVSDNGERGEWRWLEVNGKRTCECDILMSHAAL